jgi:HEAT repeat protein
MKDVREPVECYVAQLSTSKAEDAWHSLVEIGPTALPYLIEAFETADPQVKVSLIRVISEYRSTTAIPFLQPLLSDTRDDIWKAALDGFVMLGGQASLDALRFGRTTASPERQYWIGEAVRQIIEAAN